MLRRLIIFMTILCILSASAIAIDITAPFKNAKASLGNDIDVDVEKNPIQCNQDSDCEWRKCSCFNKNSDIYPDRCLINLSIDTCLCMGNACVPDIMSMLDDYNGMNVRRYQRRFMFKPECPDSEFIFFNDQKLQETHLLVLAMKGTDELNNFLDMNCGSKNIKKTLKEALGGDYFDPCNGLDFTYDSCASFRLKDCSDWIDMRTDVINQKTYGCIESFNDCAFYEETLDRMARMKASCKEDPEAFVEKCDTCDMVLVAKQKCEAQEIDKERFMEEAIEKIETLCDIRETELEQSRRLLIDDELSIDVIDQELKLASLKQGVKKFNRDILKTFTYKIKRALKLADESDDPNVKRISFLEQLEEVKEELESLSSETDSTVLTESMTYVMEDIEKTKESLD